MKIHSYILLLALGVLAARCGGDETVEFGGRLPGSEDGEYESHWYYSYEAARLLDAESLGMSASESFVPYTVAHSGDTVFIANTGSDGNSLLLFDDNKGKLLRTVKSWAIGNKTEAFGSQIEAIIPSGDRLYVAERQSLIHVFRLPDMAYVTCMGNGTWSGPVFQAQALAVKDSLIFARDKNGMISIYRESDVTKENYRNVNRYRRAGNNGSPGNNGFAAHCMLPDTAGHILLTDYEGRKIRVLDPSLVSGDMADGASIDVDSLSMSLDFKPKTLAFGDGRMYVTGDNDVVNIYDGRRKEWVKKLKTVKGYEFLQPARIYSQNDTVFWVSDMHGGRRTLVKMIVHKGEIRE